MSWASQPERGGAGATRAALWLALRGGRVAAPALVWLGTGWFLMVSGVARRASRDYLRRALGRPVGLAEVARHFHSFARAVLDRVLLLGGRDAGFTVRTEGLDHVLGVIAAGRGCILLGAHLGSFEVLRHVARQAPVPVWALMYRRNGGALTALLDRLAPSLRDRVLEVGDTSSMIRARECVERGEIVGILADRAPDAVRAGAPPETPAAGHRMVRVPFLGGAAAFPSGPFVLASTLGAPVVLFHAVRTGDRQYVVRFEPFADRVALARGSRQADLRAVVARYAAALEAACRAHPYQWFNFFPFWDETADAETDHPAHLVHDGVVAGPRPAPGGR